MGTCALERRGRGSRDWPTRPHGRSDLAIVTTKPKKGVDMTDDKKHDDKDRKKLSDEELKDVAGGGGAKVVMVDVGDRKDKMKDGGGNHEIRDPGQ